MSDSPHNVADLGGDCRIAYFDQRPDDGMEKGVIVLLHGFPQTSYQFRYVLGPFASAGYRVIAPDYRGAGYSSKPLNGFTKSVMAEDIIRLLDYLSLTEPIHLVGHDIGGMIAWSLAARHPNRVASLVWGECPLPGTAIHEEDRTIHAVRYFHFILHCVPDLAEALISGREDIYISHFFRNLCFNLDAIKDTDVDVYVRAYKQPGALRCAIATYHAFLEDTEENREWLAIHGKLNVRTLGLSSAKGHQSADAERMFAEVHEPGTYRLVKVQDSNHFIAEENPKEFVRNVLDFIQEAP